MVVASHTGLKYHDTKLNFWIYTQTESNTYQSIPNESSYQYAKKIIKLTKFQNYPKAFVIKWQAV